MKTATCDILTTTGATISIIGSLQALNVIFTLMASAIAIISGVIGIAIKIKKWKTEKREKENNVEFQRQQNKN